MDAFLITTFESETCIWNYIPLLFRFRRGFSLFSGERDTSLNVTSYFQFHTFILHTIIFYYYSSVQRWFFSEWNDDISIRLAFSKAKYILHIFQVFCISNFILCICVGNWVKREFPFTFLDDPLRFRSTTFLVHTTEAENKELVREKCSF